MAEWVWPDSIISRVLNGDTLDAILTRDIGFEGRISYPVRLRLNRINAASVRTEKGFRAKARVLALTAGARLTVTTMRGYKYGAPAAMTGEWMAEVILPSALNLSDLLVTEGLAVYWDGSGPRPDQP